MSNKQYIFAWYNPDNNEIALETYYGGEQHARYVEALEGQGCTILWGGFFSSFQDGWAGISIRRQIRKTNPTIKDKEHLLYYMPKDWDLAKI